MSLLLLFNNSLPHDDKVLFAESVRHTSAQTGFEPEMIEKDYFCSLVLRFIALEQSTAIVFKGGTCLSKVHMDFYRLSEDLDFDVSIAPECSKSERSQCAKPVKALFERMITTLPIFRWTKPLTGANANRQYLGEIEYDSTLSADTGRITLEISFREPIMLPVVNGEVHTLVKNAASNAPLLVPFELQCMDIREAMAEKVRAALTRKAPAIRDFFDLDKALTMQRIDVETPEFSELVRAKLSVPGNEHADTQTARLQSVRDQLLPRLRPVLRQADFESFDLERVIQVVQRVAMIASFGTWKIDSNDDVEAGDRAENTKSR